MNPPSRSASAVYVVGGILTLAVLSLVGMNLFLAADSRELKRQRDEAARALAAERICLHLEQVIRQPGTLPEKRQKLQDAYLREGLMALQVTDGGGRMIFARTAVGLAKDLVERLDPGPLLAQPPLPGQVLQEPVGAAGADRPGLVLARTVLYADGLQPQYLVFVLMRNPALPVMDTYEQLALLLQTIAVLSVIAVGWYFLRRMVRPYESLFQVVRHHAAAGAAPAPECAGAPGDEVAFLAESFKGVIQQLREKERELQELHRQAQSRADSSEKFARDIFSALHLAILSLDAGGRFLDGNPALEALLGRKRVALLNLGYAQLFQDAPAVVQAFEAFYGNPQPSTASGLPLPAPDGAERQVSLSISPLSSPQGAFQGAVAVLEDITGEQQLRNRLQTQENLVALGEMAAGIAHELKNSLSTISGYAQMLLGNARPGAEQKRAAALVREVEEMARVISDFLEYARPIQVERAVLSLDRLLEELLREAREKNPGVSFQASLVPVQVRGEEYLLKKAIQNLLMNAVQSMEQAPEKRVEIRMESLTRQAARLWITDTGRGMDEKTLARIFTPFFTTRPDGTGMGLAVVQKIVSLHEGAIRIHSEPGRGTTVEIDLPGWPAPPSPGPESP